MVLSIFTLYGVNEAVIRSLTLTSDVRTDYPKRLQTKRAVPGNRKRSEASRRRLHSTIVRLNSPIARELSALGSSFYGHICNSRRALYSFFPSES